MANNEINKLNLIVAALYLRYRKGSDHRLSALWAKTVVGLVIAFVILTFIELVLVSFGGIQSKTIVEEYYLVVFLSAWVISVLYVYKVTLTNHALDGIELYPEDYETGNKLGLTILVLAIVLYGLVLMYTKDI